MHKISLTRQRKFLSELDWQAHGKHVHIFGCGGLGGPSALLLAKMGAPEIHLYDFDTVEAVNMNAQLFGPQHVGMNKTEATKEILTSLSDIDAENIIIHEGDAIKGDLEIIAGSIVVLAFDSNDTRRALYKKIIKKTKKNLDIFFADARMGGLSFTVLQFKRNKVEELWDDLTPEDKDVPEDICTAKAISFNTFVCASYLAAAVRRHLKEIPQPQISLQGCVVNDVLVKIAI